MATIRVGERIYDTEKLGPCPHCGASKWTIVVNTIRGKCPECGATVNVEQNEILCTNCGFGGC